MGREIVNALDTPQSSNAFPELEKQPGQLQTTPQQTQPPADTYQDRLIKYVPTEVVALYLAVSATIASASSAPHFLSWVVFFVCLIGTPLYLLLAQDVHKKIQLIISTFAFAVWVFALGAPFTDFKWYQPIYGAILLPIVTFFVGLIRPRA